MTEEFPVTFLPLGKRVVCAGSEKLIESARRAGVRILSTCGGHGQCRTCVVRFEGALPQATATDCQGFSADEISAGWRFACLARPIGPCVVHVPAKSAATVVLDEVTGPSVVPIRQTILRPAAEKGIWWRGEHRVGPIDDGWALGLAVDLGTTNLAAAAIDLRSGRVIAAGTKENPQVGFGGDVISRMGQALQGADVARQLQHLAVQAIAEMAARLTEGHAERVAEVAVVGNSVMQHLLLGLPLQSLAQAPYVPHTSQAVEILASDLGLTLAPGAWLYFGPNIAGFVGSDHVAALLETMTASPPRCWALLDIGTNTEISLCVDGRLTSVSCASGPALEGGTLTCGMQAARGAVQSVRIEDSGLRLDTIGAVPPVGICGSGSLSLLSELCRTGVVNARSRLSARHPLVREHNRKLEFVLADELQTGALPVVFTQEDVRAMQLAKGAIRTGLDLLLAAAGVDAGGLDRLFVAGTFGKYIDINEAISVGLLPSVPRERIVQVGNAAACGARRMLVCADMRLRAQQIARQAHYIELASQTGFQETFLRRITLQTAT
jgi:uncharacterized 2Fe-2S/4Fe-4S cluster protein (DUF4445 family)